MSKPTFSQAVRSEYKQREREIKIKGDIVYKKIKTTSTNLMPTTHLYKDEYDSQFNAHYIYDINASELTMSYEKGWYWKGWSFNRGNTSNFPNFSLSPGTYTLSLIKNEDGQMGYFGLVALSGSSSYMVAEVESSTSAGTTSTTFTIASEVQIYGFEPRFYSSYPGEKTYKIMLNEGSEPLPWEPPVDEGGTEVNETFKIGEESNCQILDFNVDEKSDIYYENMPFSELSIDVDNTNGYFSDFAENNIVNYLNKKAYIDLYLNVNDTGWCKAWTMQFDSLKSTNEKATLKFQPYCSSIIKQEQMFDKNQTFINQVVWDKTIFDTYMNDNYNIRIEEDETYSGSIIANKLGTRTINNMLLEFGSAVANLEKGQILTMKDNNILRYKSNCVAGTTQETLTDNEILEKPLITREILQGIVKRFRTIESYTLDTNVFKKQIDSVFKNDTEVLVIYGDDFDLTNISSNDITLTNATLVSLNTTASGGVAGLGSHYLVLKISGNVDDRYTIQISANLPHVNEVKEKEEIYAKGKYESTKDFIKLDIPDVINTKYWEQLVNNLEKKVKLQIKALPYLQVGDPITLDEENYVITEIHTSWTGGFKMEVIAYKVNYTLT